MSTVINNRANPSKRPALIMKKGCTTSYFTESGLKIPVTLLHFPKTIVVSKRVEKENGYSALIIGYECEKSLNKPQREELRKIGIDGAYRLYESRIESSELEKFASSYEFSISHFCAGQFIDVRAKSKGKGFCGVMKRHNFSGLNATHGASLAHRTQGSTGMCQDPGKVIKGKKMAGRHGHDYVTVDNLKVLDVRPDLGVIIVNGNSIPGSLGTEVSVRDAIKKKFLSIFVSKSRA